MSKENKKVLFLLITGAIALFFYQQKYAKIKPQVKDAYAKQTIFPYNSDYQTLPEIKAYLNQLQEAYQDGLTLLPLKESELNNSAKIAQRVVLKNKKFLEDTKVNGKIVRNEIMQISPATQSDLDDKSKKTCKKDICYVVEKYNYALNSTTKALVDVNKKKVLSLKRYNNIQPHINTRLRNIAKAIAIHNPTIGNKLLFVSDNNKNSKTNIQTKIQNTPCQNKNHLCVATTFPAPSKKQIVKAVVDLTELKLVSARWIDTNKYNEISGKEENKTKKLNPQKLCNKEFKIEKDGWSITYYLSNFNGLELRNIFYKENNVAKSLQIVRWNIKHEGIDLEHLPLFLKKTLQNEKITESENKQYSFEYSQMIGCLNLSFSQATRFNTIKVKNIVQNNKITGFSIIEEFDNPKWPFSCSYRYENIFSFYKDGSFAITAQTLEQNCSKRTIYRPLIKLDIDLNTHEEFSLYINGSWQKFELEDSYKTNPTEKLYKGKYRYKISAIENPEIGYYIQTTQSQTDKNQESFEEIYISKFKDEKNTKLLDFKDSHSLNNSLQSLIANKELIENSDIVLWYLPSIIKENNNSQTMEVFDNFSKHKIKLFSSFAKIKFIPISKLK